MFTEASRLVHNHMLEEWKLVKVPSFSPLACRLLPEMPLQLPCGHLRGVRLRGGLT